MPGGARAVLCCSLGLASWWRPGRGGPAGDAPRTVLPPARGSCCFKSRMCSQAVAWPGSPRTIRHDVLMPGALRLQRTAVASSPSPGSLVSSQVYPRPSRLLLPVP